MPVYEFRCKKCEAISDEIRSVSKRNDPSFCPQCGEQTSRWIPTGTQFVLKGPRWFHDGYSSPKSSTSKEKK